MTSRAKRNDGTGLRFVAPLACMLAITAFALPGGSRAADLPVPEKGMPPAAKPEPAMPPKAERDNFDGLDANCVEANDGCRNYLRAAAGKFDPVNNIGIACQPKAPVCTKTR